MKKKWVYLAMLGILVGSAVVALAVAPSSAPSEPDDAQLPEGPVAPLEFEINCEFLCNNGTGYAILDCEEGGLNECCLLAVPACENDEGLDNGICRKGRLGLPCQPI